MTLLDAGACVTVCNALGPFGEIVMVIAAGAYGWWKSRQAAAAKVEAKAARVEASTAKSEVQRLISMRPPSTIVIDTSAGKPRASIADPSVSGEERLPYAASLPTVYVRAPDPEPRDDEDTARETPHAKDTP